MLESKPRERLRLRCVDDVLAAFQESTDALNTFLEFLSTKMSFKMSIKIYRGSGEINVFFFFFFLTSVAYSVDGEHLICFV